MMDQKAWKGIAAFPSTRTRTIHYPDIILWYLCLRCRGKKNIFKMCQIIHGYIKPVHLEMRHRSLQLLSISDLENVFHLLIGCFKTNILQLTPNVSSIRTKSLLKFPILNVFLWKQAWWKEAQCQRHPGRPRLRGSGQGYRALPELQLGSSQQQGLCNSRGRKGEGGKVGRGSEQRT